jgi:hypothetical protein
MRKSQHSRIVPKHIWEKMNPADQQHYNAGHVTDADLENWFKGLEKDMHDQFAGWLERNGFHKKYIHARMDKKTGIGRGVFDFTIWHHGRICFVEFKTDKGRVSEEQTEFLAAQIADRTPAMVAHSYQDAVRFVEDVFDLIS